MQCVIAGAGDVDGVAHPVVVVGAGGVESASGVGGGFHADAVVVFKHFRFDARAHGWFPIHPGGDAFIAHQGLGGELAEPVFDLRGAGITHVNRTHAAAIAAVGDHAPIPAAGIAVGAVLRSGFPRPVGRRPAVAVVDVVGFARHLAAVAAQQCPGLEFADEEGRLQAGDFVTPIAAFAQAVGIAVQPVGVHVGLTGAVSGGVVPAPEAGVEVHPGGYVGQAAAVGVAVGIDAAVMAGQ